ncbi:putative ribonuclease H-like domain-containing protein [Tanacetum coccineum]
MSAKTDNFSLHDDEELSLHDDASLDGSVPASNKGDAPAKPPQIITTNTLSNIKLPVLQKDDYDTWAMEMEHYLEYIDNEVWKVIQNGNSKKRVIQARFHGMDDAKEIWAAIKIRFGDIQKTSSSTLTADNVAFLSQAKASSSKHKPSHSSGSYSSYTTSSSKATTTATPGLADEVIHSFSSTNADDVDLIHEDLDQIGLRVDGKMHVAFDKRKVECFNCHNTGHFARECKFKGSKEGNRQEAGKGQNFKPVQIEKEALMTIDEGQINWVEQTADEELNHALMAFTVNNELAVKKLESQLRASHKQQTSLTEKLNFQANQIFEKDEKLKKYRRIGMKAVKDKDALQKIVDSWFASSKNLWKLIDCGMSSTVKIGLGYGIQSNAEVLGYEEEISRGIFAFRETNAGYNDIPLYSRFKQVEYKGVPHPLSGDYTPREQEDIDDSLYEYGKYGPQPQSPSPTVSDASSIVFSICPSNDSDGELGAVSDHSVNDDPIHDHIPIPSIEQVTIATQKTQPQVPKPKQTVDPSCAQHVKTPRQPIRTPVISSPIPSNNRQNWNQQMERELGAGYSFERKPCFVCGSLSHLIKDCDYYEKKMAREAALKSQRVVHADIQQATPAWTNTNRVNKANQFTPRPVQLSNIRPNLSTASKTIKTGRVNVNTGHGNVNSGSVHINSGTQIKSGPSRFNTGKQHVNSGSVHINSGIQFKSGASRFNTGKQHINSGSVHVNTARVNRPVPNNTSPKPSQVNLKSPKKCFSKQRSPVNRPFSRNTAHKSNKYAVKGKMGTAVKTSAGCVWRKVIPLSNTNSGPTPESNVIVSRGPQGRPKPVKAWVFLDMWLFWALAGNRAILKIIKNYPKWDCYFGGSKRRSVGIKICDKKLNVLFTEKECFVVSSDFKMPDENQVLLKVPRQHNMYTFDMKNVDSSKGYTCLLAKASSDEAKLWHRRLGHLNFKNLNKLVKGNLVRGLPSKSFKNDHTCVACQKGKQHKASCKAKIDRYVTHPLHTLHMDLFGPTSVRSINHASYCLVITDDYSSPLGKFDGKSDEGFLVGYSVNSKAFRVYNLVTKRVEVNLHVNFLEEKPNIQGIGHRWMFDLDYLTDSMNYIPVSLQNQANPAGTKEVIDIDVQTEEAADLLVVSSTSLKGATRKAAVSEKIATKKPSSTPISKSADDIMTFRKELDALALKHLGPVPATAPTSTNPVNTGSDNLNTGFEEVTTGNIEAISPSADHEEEVFSDADDDEMPEIRIYDKSSEGIFEKASYDDDGIITDFNNLPDEVDVSTNHTLRIHNAHPQSQILGDPNTPVQTRSSLKKFHEAHALVKLHTSTPTEDH